MNYGGLGTTDTGTGTATTDTGTGNYRTSVRGRRGDEHTAGEPTHDEDDNNDEHEGTNPGAPVFVVGMGTRTTATTSRAGHDGATANTTTSRAGHEGRRPRRRARRQRGGRAHSRYSPT